MKKEIAVEIKTGDKVNMTFIADRYKGLLFPINSLEGFGEEFHDKMYEMLEDVEPILHMGYGVDLCLALPSLTELLLETDNKLALYNIMGLVEKSVLEKMA